MTRHDVPGDAGSLIDISVAVTPGTPEWPGDTPFSCRWTWEIARGDSVNVSAMGGSPHVGTHADAPFHVDSAWQGVESLPLELFSGEATVVDVSGSSGALSLASLGLPASGPAGGRLLLRTGCSIASGAFPGHWPWIGAGVVEALVETGLRLLGVDAPSVDPRDSRGLEVHRALFRGGAGVLENLDLRAVAPGAYHLAAWPVKYVGLDAAPVRAVLRRLDRA
jgi:arylformamidase